ncbi:hypothetical protein BDP81DRAFT_127525 [Colletotrichum phormii]|uniref:Uncharacterized protein n=1 Tax=Colletotrichum phormii TaxID=359342 RepID=A0AAJ0ELI7_9PEZI|nr:uncharacterized protein BDP81DRAFT_127525 [Colletotrichum phormii]KAK1641111.1 hypothetical protein BDP81DRAFT_127525 [Colletotrichum phormii]
MNDQTNFFLSRLQTLKARGSVRRSLMRSTARARGRSQPPQQWGSLRVRARARQKGGKVRGSRVQVDRRRRRSAACLTASRIVVSGGHGPHERRMNQNNTTSFMDGRAASQNFHTISSACLSHITGFSCLDLPPAPKPAPGFSIWARFPPYLLS